VQIRRRGSAMPLGRTGRVVAKTAEHTPYDPRQTYPENAMTIADKRSYLAGTIEVLKGQWPENRTVNVICHGHSVPAGYFATPMVDTFNAYPHLLHAGLKHRFPFAVVNVIVTAVGGEHSASGAERFERDVLCHRPDVITIDYGLNDRGIGLDQARLSWQRMIEQALASRTKVILLTPTADATQQPTYTGDDRAALAEHAEQIRQLASAFEIGLADSLAAFQAYQQRSGDLSDLLSWSNHPNRNGHALVARELLRWFPIG
jgi:acyl-CoA thioesterase I